MMKNKFGYALIAIVVSFGLWLYVITTVSPESEETYYNIPVVMDGESVLAEHNLMITEKPQDGVTVRLSGNRSDLIKVDSNTIIVKADLGKIREPGRITLRLSSPTFPGDVPPNALKVEVMHPDSVTVTVEERRNKEVPVEIKWVGSTPDGFMIDRENRILDYEAINVVGPASVADQIEKAVIEVDLDDRKESISESYRYTLCNSEGEPVDARLITTNAEEVRLDVKIVRFKDMRLSYNLKEGGGAKTDNTTIRMSANTIRVSGSEAALEELGDQLVIGTIYLRDLPKDTKLTFPINLPEGVNNLSGVTEVEVEVSFSGLSVKDFVVSAINSTNVPEGMEADIITEKINVSVRGPAGMMAALKEEDITLVVDFTGAETGTSTFKAAVIFPEPFQKVGALGTVSVSATITKK